MCPIAKDQSWQLILGIIVLLCGNTLPLPPREEYTRDTERDKQSLFLITNFGF